MFYGIGYYPYECTGYSLYLNMNMVTGAIPYLSYHASHYLLKFSVNFLPLTPLSTNDYWVLAVDTEWFVSLKEVID